MSTEGGRWSRKPKNLSTYFVNAPLCQSFMLHSFSGAIHKTARWKKGNWIVFFFLQILNYLRPTSYIFLKKQYYCLAFYVHTLFPRPIYCTPTYMLLIFFIFKMKPMSFWQKKRDGKSKLKFLFATPKLPKY